MIKPIRQSVNTEYYKDRTRLNKSMLVEFMKSPMRFKQLNEKPEHLDFKALRDGTMIHKYILEFKDFYNDYKLIKCKTPSTDLQHEFCNKIIDFYSPFVPDDKDFFYIVNFYKELYKTGNLKDETVESKARDLYDSLSEYINEVQQTNKTLLSDYQLDKLNTYNKSIQSHVAAKRLLEEDEYTFSEFHINWEWISGDMRIPCKSLLDRVKFDIKNKKVYLIDLKTTSNVGNFKESYDKYTYGIQLAFYSMSLNWYIDNILEDKSSDWVIESYIIALDKLSNEVRVFGFDYLYLEEDYIKINLECEKLHWHLQHDLWEHRYEYYINDGIEIL